MPSLADVFATLNRMREERVIEDYAIGGATAVLFYAEPTRTYDVDAFVLPAAEGGDPLAPLPAVYGWARAQGFAVEAEHLLVHGVPVQVLPAFAPLVADAIRTARIHDYEGVPVSVVGPEHLIALALLAGGARRRERAWHILESAGVDRARLRALLADHGIDAEVPDGV
jgi:hypothetical protein